VGVQRWVRISLLLRKLEYLPLGLPTGCEVMSGSMRNGEYAAVAVAASMASVENDFIFEIVARMTTTSRVNVRQWQ